MKTDCGWAFVVLLGLLLSGTGARADDALVRNPAFKEVENGDKPAGYALGGGAVYRRIINNPVADSALSGVALNTAAGGSVSQTVEIDAAKGRAFAFRIRALPQDGFAAADDGLLMQVEFFGDKGRTSYDRKVKSLYPLVRQARQDLAVNGNGGTGGAAVWREYVLNFYVPFPQVDRLRLAVGCKAGAGSTPPGSGARPRGNGPMIPIDTSGNGFLVSEFSLVRLPEPQPAPGQGEATVLRPAPGSLRPLGGRWFYFAKPGETRCPPLFDHTNADRLLYRDGPDGQFQAPFGGNMHTVLRAGAQDLAGEILSADRPLMDNVTVRFDARSMIVHTHGIPNHPTGRFPEDRPGRGGNPSYIQEQDETFYFPLEPVVDAGHAALDKARDNGALNMGPIGMAVNGVVFFNPYDAGHMDATNIMDRCCGHPNPDGQYHYHKYPICLNSPWADEGKGHSPLLGWAFDGFPVYGPYESANVMAKDVTGPMALNAFNLHQDAQRGWHYHVTPGRFPYLIGGYWGKADARNVHAPRRRGRGPEGAEPPFPPPGLEEGLPPWLMP